MDFRSLECFLKVAELQHFGLAAAELHISQPALTQRIQTLEREVGAKLLERDRRGVDLTEAGMAFTEPARAALHHGRYAADMAGRAARGQQGRLRLGFTVIASHTSLPRAIQRFRRAYPGVTLDLTEINSPGVEAGLERGELDLGILHPPLERAGLVQRELPDERLKLAIPAEHRLAARTRIRFGDLDGEPLLVAPRHVGPVLFDKLVGCFRAAGVEPNIVQQATPMTTLTGLVAAGAGIGFVTDGIAASGRPGVAFRTVTGAPSVPMAVAWTGAEPMPTARRFLATLRPRGAARNDSGKSSPRDVENSPTAPSQG